MDRNELSVLMSVYGGDNPDHLAEALESILGQKYLPGQIVIVVDGPLSVYLESVLDRCRKTRPDLFSITRLPENRGPAEAWNCGLDECRYELVARMDADDISLPERFEKQVQFLRSHPEVDVVGSYYREFEENRYEPISIHKPPTDHESLLKYAKIQLRNPFCHPSVMYRKSSIIANGKYIQMSCFVDFYMWARMSVGGCIFANIPEVLLEYRGGHGLAVRRGGIEYLRNESRFLRKCYKIGFISYRSYLVNHAFRPFVRIAPVFFRKALYRKLLRQPLS